VLAALGFDDRLVEKAREVVLVLVGDHDDVAAAPAVAAVGAALRDELFAAEADAAPAAVAGLGVNFDLIDKHRRALCRCRVGASKQKRGGWSSSSSSSSLSHGRQIMIMRKRMRKRPGGRLLG
jgi:hypothetical protein